MALMTILWLSFTDDYDELLGEIEKRSKKGAALDVSFPI